MEANITSVGPAFLAIIRAPENNNNKSDEAHRIECDQNKVVVENKQNVSRICHVSTNKYNNCGFAHLEVLQIHAPISKPGAYSIHKTQPHCMLFDGKYEYI